MLHNKKLYKLTWKLYYIHVHVATIIRKLKSLTILNQFQ